MYTAFTRIGLLATFDSPSRMCIYLHDFSFLLYIVICVSWHVWVVCMCCAQVLHVVGFVLQRFCADVLSVLSMTMSESRECLKFRKLGSLEPIGSWGHEYVR